jgi:hypothetical protein
MLLNYNGSIASEQIEIEESSLLRSIRARTELEMQEIHNFSQNSVLYLSSATTTAEIALIVPINKNICANFIFSCRGRSARCAMSQTIATTTRNMYIDTIGLK